MTYTTLGALAAVLAYGAGYLVLTGAHRVLTQAPAISLTWVASWRTRRRTSGRTSALHAVSV